MAVDFGHCMSQQFERLSLDTNAVCASDGELSRHRFTFHIRKYFAFSCQVVESPAFPPEPKEKPKWRLVLQSYPLESEQNDFTISVNVKRVSNQPIYPTAWFSVQLVVPKTKEKVALKCGSSQRATWSTGLIPPGLMFTSNFSKRTFLGGEFDSTLTLICDVVVPEKQSIVSIPQYVDKIPDCRLLEDMAALFNSAQFADVTVVCKGQEFPCHKAIITIRSPVLAAMFRHDTKESAENRVHIEDMEPEVLAEMLRFIYTGKVNNLTKMASQLLHAADKYSLERLKLMCEDELCRNLNMDTLKEALILADRHSAQHLLTQANQMMKSLDVTFSTESK